MANYYPLVNEHPYTSVPASPTRVSPNLTSAGYDGERSSERDAAALGRYRPFFTPSAEDGHYKFPEERQGAGGTIDAFEQRIQFHQSQGAQPESPERVRAFYLAGHNKWVAFHQVNEKAARYYRAQWLQAKNDGPTNVDLLPYGVPSDAFGAVFAPGYVFNRAVAPERRLDASGPTGVTAEPKRSGFFFSDYYEMHLRDASSVFLHPPEEFVNNGLFTFPKTLSYARLAIINLIAETWQQEDDPAVVDQHECVMLGLEEGTAVPPKLFLPVAWLVRKDDPTRNQTTVLCSHLNHFTHDLNPLNVTLESKEVNLSRSSRGGSFCSGYSVLDPRRLFETEPGRRDGKYSATNPPVVSGYMCKHAIMCKCMTLQPVSCHADEDIAALRTQIEQGTLSCFKRMQPSEMRFGTGFENENFANDAILDRLPARVMISDENHPALHPPSFEEDEDEDGNDLFAQTIQEQPEEDSNDDEEEEDGSLYEPSESEHASDHTYSTDFDSESDAEDVVHLEIEIRDDPTSSSTGGKHWKFHHMNLRVSDTPPKQREGTTRLAPSTPPLGVDALRLYDGARRTRVLPAREQPQSSAAVWLEAMCTYVKTLPDATHTDPAIVQTFLESMDPPSFSARGMKLWLNAAKLLHQGDRNRGQAWDLVKFLFDKAYRPYTERMELAIGRSASVQAAHTEALTYTSSEEVRRGIHLLNAALLVPSSCSKYYNRTLHYVLVLLKGKKALQFCTSLRYKLASAQDEIYRLLTEVEKERERGAS